MKAVIYDATIEKVLYRVEILSTNHVHEIITPVAGIGTFVNGPRPYNEICTIGRYNDIYAII